MPTLALMEFLRAAISERGRSVVKTGSRRRSGIGELRSCCASHRNEVESPRPTSTQPASSNRCRSSLPTLAVCLKLWTAVQSLCSVHLVTWRAMNVHRRRAVFRLGSGQHCPGAIVGDQKPLNATTCHRKHRNAHLSCGATHRTSPPTRPHRCKPRPTAEDIESILANTRQLAAARSFRRHGALQGAEEPYNSRPIRRGTSLVRRGRPGRRRGTRLAGGPHPRARRRRTRAGAATA